MNWDRWAASTGIGFVVVLLVAFLTFGDAPGLDAPAADKAAFFTDHRSRILIAMVLAAIALMLFLWFAATLANVLREAGEPRPADAVLGGSAVLVGLVMLFAAIQAALAATVAASADEATTAALRDWARAPTSSRPGRPRSSSGPSRSRPCAVLSCRAPGVG